MQALVRRRVVTHLLAIHAVVNYAATYPEAVIAVKRISETEVIRAAGQGTITVLGSQTAETRSLTILNADTGAPMVINVQWNSSLTIQTDLARSRPFGYVLKSTETKIADVSRKVLYLQTVNEFFKKKINVFA